MLNLTISILLLFSSNPSIPEENVEELLNYARSFEGTPYKYGGTTPKAFDCSGFVRYVYNNFGYELKQASHGLAFEGFQLPVSDLAPGDLIFFRKDPNYKSAIGHVGIVLENNQKGILFIHASSSRGVIISNLGKETYFLKRVEGGVRI